MAKQDSRWLKHDFNARRDQKILEMRSVYGAEGYGWYWMLVEQMAEATDYRLRVSGKYSIQTLALEIRADQGMLANFILDCINEFSLFESDGEYFWSPSLCRRMEPLDSKRIQCQEAAAERWRKHREEVTAKDI